MGEIFFSSSFTYIFHATVTFDDDFILNDLVLLLFYFSFMLLSSTDTTTVGVEARCSTADKKPAVSEFRRALPQFCVVGVKNLILLGNVMRWNNKKKLWKIFNNLDSRTTKTE